MFRGLFLFISEPLVTFPFVRVLLIQRPFDPLQNTPAEFQQWQTILCEREKV